LNLDDLAIRSGYIVDPRNGVLQKMHQKRIIHKLRSLSLEHAVVIRAISHGSGLLSNGVLSPKRISGETEIPEKRVREILAELKAMREPI
jgi:hypothetical protein